LYWGSEIVSATAEQIEAGQAVYTRRTLRAYDFIVLGVSNRVIWKCPTSQLLEHYNDHVTDNHLDVGVGSGYFPDRCRFGSSAPRVALMDLNADALEFASSRIRRYHPETYRRDVLKPLAWEGDKFDSIAVNYLIHCLPGTMQTKSVIFDHLAQIMNPGAVVFGSTLLQGGVQHGWTAKRLMSFYNDRGIFSNTDDNLADLEAAIHSRFSDVQIKVIGCAALFSGRVP
jgi:2-polyprenyl-3-methyl-5-hydroxy-6-metoxy-1,4-benzoquinol methylase